jgi:hypothetical protein
MQSRRLGIASAAVLGAMLAAIPDAMAAAKLDEGFASMVLTDGTSLIPRNRITNARAGDDVVYWIKWKDPMPRSTLRCVVTGPDTNIDETENFAEPEGGGFSICAIETETGDAGQYTFTQYLDGEKVGEAHITLDPLPFFDKMTRRRQGKIILAAFALLIVGIYWFRRWRTGDTRSMKQLARGETGAEMAVELAVASRGTVSSVPTRVKSASKAPPLEPADPVADFKKRLAVDPAHRASSAEEAWTVARAARKAGDTAVAVAAVRGFDKAWPGHALVPEVYLFSAKMMFEDLANPEMARKIAQHIVQKYPGHFVAPEAKRLLAALPNT